MKRFVLDTLDSAKELAIRARIYLFEMALDQKGESYAVRKAARLAALKKCKATVEKEFEKRNRGEMTEEVPDERTFYEMLFQLEELMLKLQQEFTEYDVNFLPIFHQELLKVGVLISRHLLMSQIKKKDLLMYHIDLEFRKLFKTPAELNRFAVKTFERTFFVVLLDSIEAIIDELRIRDQLEMELPRSKSSMGLFYFLKSGQNDNSESEDDTDYYV